MCVSDGRDGVFACHQSNGGLAGVQLNHLCQSKRDLLPHMLKLIGSVVLETVFALLHYAV